MIPLDGIADKTALDELSQVSPGLPDVAHPDDHLLVLVDVGYKRLYTTHSRKETEEPRFKSHMSSINRRTLLAGTGAAIGVVSGCTASSSGENSNAEEQEEPDPHWVSMYMDERDQTLDVAVTITNEKGDVLFEKEYRLSGDNQADEDAPFPASTEPETIVVIVDGVEFERDWPGFEQPQLPCNNGNTSGIEIYVENTKDGTPDIRFEASCQSVLGG